ncbi:hypothetical protein E4T56_gene12743 [Termitomyces sp. T112]|nr:hypothetical protein E4T56_gene12743 [Termitomyces sp. T112]
MIVVELMGCTMFMRRPPFLTYKNSQVHQYLFLLNICWNDPLKNDPFKASVSTRQPIDNTRQKERSLRRETGGLSWKSKIDILMEKTTCRPRKDFVPYEDIDILERSRELHPKNERYYKRRKLSRDDNYHDAREYGFVSIKTTSNEPIIVPEEDAFDSTITYDGVDYEGYNDKRVTRVYSHISSECLDDRTNGRCVNRRETSRLTYEYPKSELRQFEWQLKETQKLLNATIQRSERLSDSLLDTQAELTRVYEQRDLYMNNAHDLRGELVEMQAQLDEVETRNYTLTKDYETLERDNACLRRYSDELTKALQSTFSQKDRRDLHHIRRRILVDKTIEALKRRYCDSYPIRSNEPFYCWSKRVGYPGWERIASMIMDAKLHGNKSAHQATQAEMLQTVTHALEDDLESGYTGEGEVLRDMYSIVYSEEMRS